MYTAIYFKDVILLKIKTKDCDISSLLDLTELDGSHRFNTKIMMMIIIYIYILYIFIV